MSAKPRDLGMTPLDDLFSTDESRAEAQLEKVVTLNPADISDFPNHPFKVKQDEAMAEMVDSVKLYLISSIVTVPIDDGVKFQLKSISEIMDEAEYPGIRVSMSTTFDGVVTPLKIDISTGDAITPREVRYSFKLMLEDRSIDIWAYNLETVLAEKLETIITRTTTNTRMRDFYDIYILEQLHGTTLNPKILHDALLATAHKRGSEKYLNQAEEVFDEVENDSVMQKLWEAYRKKFSYASDLEWDVIMKAIRRLYVLCEKGISL